MSKSKTPAISEMLQYKNIKRWRFFCRLGQTGMTGCFQSTTSKEQNGIICGRTTFTVQEAKKLHISILIKLLKALNIAIAG